MKNLITRQKEFMKTTITFKVVQNGASTVDVLDAIEEGFGEFDRIVKKFTRFDENSELSNLNRNSGSFVQITPEFLTLIKYMLDLAEKTDGDFDPTIIDFLEIYGYDKNYDFSKLDNPELDKLVEKIRNERPSFREIEIDEKNISVKLAKGQKIDLGGIGKGYAIDCAFEKLNLVSKNFLIDAGGDIRAIGKNENDQIWTAAFRNLNKDGVIEDIGFIELNNEALASSGSWARKVKQFHHLINPKTGLPGNKYTTVYVKAPTGMISDSWATALFIGGEEKFKKLNPKLAFYTI
jgi:thiamine biosynthesis lipoprotein